MNRKHAETTRKRNHPAMTVGRWLLFAVLAGFAISAGMNLLSASALADEEKPPPNKGKPAVDRQPAAPRQPTTQTSQPTGRRVINAGRGQNPDKLNVRSLSVGARKRGSTSRPTREVAADRARRQREARARRAAAARRRSARRNKNVAGRGKASMRFTEVRSKPVQDAVDYGVEDVLETENGKQYRIRYKFDSRLSLYYVFQNEFIDRGGVPGLMTFKATARDRTVVKQTMQATQGAPGTPGGGRRFYKAVWEYDRFQIEESVMGKSASFDSLKETYPVRKLRRLGRVPGTKIEFLQNGWTGEFLNVQVQYGNDRLGPTTREKLSRTSQRADIEPENLQRVFDDLGTLILPRRPVAVGDHWQRERRAPIRNFGDSVTRYDLSLRDVVQDGSDLIAEVQIAGSITLEKEAENDAAENETTNSGTVHQNGKPIMPKPRQRQVKKDAGGEDFELDRAAVEGKYRFNITKGRLVEFELRRVREMSADMESEAMGQMSLESGEAHTMRVTVSTTEPAKPIIIGGPKPPDEPEPETPEAKPTGRPTSQQMRMQQEAREQARKRREERQKRAEQSLKERLEAARRAREKATSQPANDVVTDEAPARNSNQEDAPAPTTQPANS